MKKQSLTDLQLSVMNVLWACDEASVGDVHARLTESGKTLAPTTVATLLQRLSTAGWVAHRKEGRQLRYRAAVDKQTATDGAIQRLAKLFFGGNVGAMTAQLIESDALTSDDIVALRALLDERQE